MKKGHSEPHLHDITHGLNLNPSQVKRDERVNVSNSLQDVP